MVDQPLSVDFVYKGVDVSTLFERHKNAIENHTEASLDGRVITSNGFDSIHITPYEVIDSKWYFEDLDDFEYESPSATFDLTASPLIEYVTKSQDYVNRYRNEHDVSGDEALSELLTLLRVAYNQVSPKPVAVFSQDPNHAFNIRMIGGPPITAESLANDRLRYLPWLAVFPPAMVESYGRETLLSAPAWKVEELDDGAILIVCHDDIDDWQADGRAVADHIGLPWYEDIQ